MRVDNVIFRGRLQSERLVSLIVENDNLYIIHIGNTQFLYRAGGGTVGWGALKIVDKEVNRNLEALDQEPLDQLAQKSKNLVVPLGNIRSVTISEPGLWAKIFGTGSTAGGPRITVTTDKRTYRLTLYGKEMSQAQELVQALAR